MPAKLTDHEAILQRHSAVATQPRRAFRDWVESVAHTDPLKRTVEQLMASEPIIWMIPSTGTFDSGQHLSDYIDSLKFGMMITELRDICSDQSLWPSTTPESFDAFFEIVLYDHVVSASNIEGAKM